MTIKEELRALVDDLSDHEAEQVLIMVRRLRALAAWEAAPADDEEETDEERAAVAEAKAELAAGQGIAWDRVRRRRLH